MVFIFSAVDADNLDEEPPFELPPAELVLNPLEPQPLSKFNR